MLYCTTLVLRCTVLCCAVLSCAVPCYVALAALNCAVLLCAALCCAALCLHCAALHCAALCCAAFRAALCSSNGLSSCDAARRKRGLPRLMGEPCFRAAASSVHSSSPKSRRHFIACSADSPRRARVRPNYRLTARACACPPPPPSVVLASHEQAEAYRQRIALVYVLRRK